MAEEAGEESIKNPSIHNIPVGEDKKNTSERKPFSVDEDAPAKGDKSETNTTASESIEFFKKDEGENQYSPEIENEDELKTKQETDGEIVQIIVDKPEQKSKTGLKDEEDKSMSKTEVDPISGEETDSMIKDEGSSLIELESSNQELERTDSITYNHAGRTYDDVGAVDFDLEGEISGDFRKKSGDVLELLILDMPDVEDEEEIEPIWVPSMSAFERESKELRLLYLNKYHKLVEQETVLKNLNSLLHLEVVMNFRKRHLRGMDKKEDLPYDFYQNYLDKLDVYATFLKSSKAEHQYATLEIDSLRKRNAKKKIDVEEQFLDFQNRLSYFANGLMFKKNASVLPDKVIERLLKRQKYELDKLSTMRSIKNQVILMISAKQKQLEGLEIVGTNHTLNYLDKLKTDNRNLFDKTEEKELELASYRKKTKQTVGILSHLREKLNAGNHDHEDLKEEFLKICENVRHTRAKLNAVKTERDTYRISIEKIKQEAGLLVHPNLLRDMQKSQKEVVCLREELHELKYDCKNKVRQFRNVRRASEGAMVIRARRSTIASKSTRHRKSIKSNREDQHTDELLLSKRTHHESVIPHVENFKPIIKKMSVRQ